MATSNFDWRNAAFFACTLGTAICTAVTSYADAGNKMPWGIGTAGFLLASAVFGAISHSLLGSTGAKDMHGEAAPGASPEVKAQAAVTRAQSIKPMVPPLSLLMLCMGIAGCISSAPIVPVTPGNQAQVSSCQGIASLHNGVVIGDFVVGGTTAGLAGVAAAVSDHTTKTDLAIAAAITGAVGVAGTAIAGFTSASFANSQCSNVVGPLAAAKKPEPAQ